MLAVRLSPPSRRLMYVVCTCRKTGGTWQILKTEIGGDGQSSYGSESAVMHTATDVNYNRGYETWLLREARARDPGHRGPDGARPLDQHHQGQRHGGLAYMMKATAHQWC